MIRKESIFESKGSSIRGQGKPVRGGLTNSDRLISDSLPQPKPCKSRPTVEQDIKRTRQDHAPGFKAMVALAAIKGDKTLAELSEHFDVHSNQILEWKQQLQKSAVNVFDSSSKSKTAEPDLKALHAKIGQLTLENNFFRKRTHQGEIAERKEMIVRTHEETAKPPLSSLAALISGVSEDL